MASIMPSEYFKKRLMQDPQVHAFKIGTDYVSVLYEDGVTVTIYAVTDKIIETAVLSFETSIQEWDWERETRQEGGETDD